MVAVSAGASARPVLEMSPQMTTSQVLDACGSDDASARADDCGRLFESLMRTGLEALKSPVQEPGVVCFPRGETPENLRRRIIAWIRAHPDVKPLEFIGEGSRQAFVGAYACK